MNNTLTARNVELPKETPIPASGTWQASGYHGVSILSPISQGPIRDSLVALALAISPLTFGVDPWFVNRRRDFSVTRQLDSQRRRITLRQAREIALHVLLAAEHERSLIAEQEAGIRAVWEDES